MTEWMDNVGVKHHTNESLGMEDAKYGYSPLCHFFPDDYREDVYLNCEGEWNDGMHGLHVGWMDPIKDSPRYEYILWDDGSRGWLHESHLR